MQLFLEPEQTPNINNKMSTLEEETINERLIAKELNGDPPNGNKENIESVNNIIKSDENKNENDKKEPTILDPSDNDKDKLDENEKTEKLSYDLDDTNEKCTNTNNCVTESEEGAKSSNEKSSSTHDVPEQIESELEIVAKQVKSELMETDNETCKQDDNISEATHSSNVSFAEPVENGESTEAIKETNTTSNVDVVVKDKPAHAENDFISKDTVDMIEVQNVDEPIHIPSKELTEVIKSHSEGDLENVKLENMETEQECDKKDKKQCSDDIASSMDNNNHGTEMSGDSNSNIPQQNLSNCNKESEAIEINNHKSDKAHEDVQKSEHATELSENIEKNEQTDSPQYETPHQELPHKKSSTVAESELPNEGKCEEIIISVSEKITISSAEASIHEDVVVIENNDKEQEPPNINKEVSKSEFQEEIMNVDDVNENEITSENTPTEKTADSSENDTIHNKSVETKKHTSLISRLSNTLDILSDDDEDTPLKEISKPLEAVNTLEIISNKQCINIDDDDDIMLIDEESDSKEEKSIEKGPESDSTLSASSNPPSELGTDKLVPEINDESPEGSTKIEDDTIVVPVVVENPTIDEDKATKPEIPLLSDNFLLSCKKNIADMSRDDLEELCVLKIVESIVDRININEFKTKQKTMSQTLDEYKKKTLSLTKQLRDLQVVLKSVQEEQKKGKSTPITPLKITRSVGMQVLMTDKASLRRKLQNSVTSGNSIQNNNIPANKLPRNANQSPRPQKMNNNQQIPVPGLVPAANNIAIKSPPAVQSTSANSNSKLFVSLQNGVKNPSPVQKTPEKRSHNRIQSVTVDLTDDEPPAKVATRLSSNPPVRLVPPQSLLAPRPPTPQQTTNSPRRVYIPISGPQNQALRPGQAIMLKTVAQGPGQRQRVPNQMVRMPNSSLRRIASARHPAPLPDAMKQYQPPNWKALPPAPDLKLSKVENGIVISWKIEGYQEDSYEEIASYQLYAYQENASPPSTALWKKIGDVKALPLPMACTLTQFMAGFKYYFAVRAVDVRSRLGPFSLPGSILLLNKM